MMPANATLLKRFLGPALLALAPLACDDGDQGIFAPPTEVANISLSAPRLELAAGETMQLDVVATDPRGVRFVEPPVTFSSSNPAVATVDDAGLVTARQVGTAVISASAGEIDASATVTVISGRASTLAVGIADGAVMVGGVAELEHGDTGVVAVQATDVAGNQVSGRFVNIYSLSPAVLEVSPEGQFVGVSPGTAFVVVELDELVDTLEFRVNPSPRSVVRIEVSPESSTLMPGESVTLSATAYNFEGEPIAPGTIMPNGEPVRFVFEPVRPGVGTVAASGLFTATGMGTTEVVARVPSLPEGAVTGSATVAVGPATAWTPEAGRAGALVTFTGSRLDEVTAVTFGGVSAPIRRQSESELVAWVPVGALDGPIVFSGVGSADIASGIDFDIDGPGDVFDPASDDPSTAPVLAVGYSNPELFASTDDDREDWYVIDPQGAGSVTITVPFDPPDFDLYVFEIEADGSVGDEITFAWYDNPEVVTWATEPGKRYYLLVDAYDGTGRYELIVSAP